jgi:hypothetical protein
VVIVLPTCTSYMYELGLLARLTMLGAGQQHNSTVCTQPVVAQGIELHYQTEVSLEWKMMHAKTVDRMRERDRVAATCNHQEDDSIFSLTEWFLLDVGVELVAPPAEHKPSCTRVHATESTYA